MKFRRLTNEELEHLEKEFIDFLCSNTVTADDWESLKVNEPENAEALIEMFSDVVLEKVYTKVSFLEKREKDNLMIFKISDEMIQLLGISITGDSNVDFTDSNSIQSYLAQNKSVNSQISGFRNTKVIATGSKTEEVFQLISSGCVVGEETFFNTLDQIID